jgi:O-antigen chain-terminating methyltransferase
MVAEARARGHEAALGDALAYLRGLPDASVAGVTSFHLVEHLPFETLIALIDETRRVLVEGGVLLLETPNPENLVAGAFSFNYDPTHVKPLPPELLRFLIAERGLPGRIIRSAADCAVNAPDSTFAPAEVNDWFRLPMDYAIFAHKAAAPAAGQ